MPDAPQDLGLDAEQLARFESNLQSSDVEDTLKEDIAELQGHVETIRALFKKVLGSLEDFDDKYFHTDPTRHLAPDWESFYNRFSEYVENSRASAASASSIMNLYAQAILGKVKEKNCNVQALATELKIFQQEVERHIPAAKGTRHNFKQLAEDIRAFERKIERTLNHLNTPPTQDMSLVCDNIDVLKQKVAAMSDESSALGSGYFGLLASLAPLAAGLLCTLAPRAAIKALRTVFNIPTPEIDAEKRAEVQATLDRYVERVPALLENAHIPREIRPFYEDWWASTREDIRTVSSRIDAISQIWYYLHMDLLKLETKLSACANSDNVVNSGFLMDKIDASKTVLLRLAKCLELYVNQLPQDSTAPGGAV